MTDRNLNRKRARAIRLRMAQTGEPYTVAARAVDEAHAAAKRDADGAETTGVDAGR